MRKEAKLANRRSLSRGMLQEIVNVTPHVLKLPYGKMSFDYDRNADVLYISFKRPQKATTSEMLKEGIVIRYRGKEVVGMTVLDASKR